ncbi:hypothetical protein VB1_CDS0063 [Arthrobacter phage Marchesin]|nr:hypothetical protein VB1_CDS0063 [Arthrobacter phage Marchesin]
MSLPSCSVQHPACGACGDETSSDGESFYCDDCGLDYGDGSDTQAEFRDEDAEVCGEPCSNSWHARIFAEPMICSPCELPEGHKSDHWTDCRFAVAAAVEAER